MMNTEPQLPMYDRRPPVRRDHPETSYKAADAIAPVTGNMRQLVYKFGLARGPYGFTDDELFAAYPDASQSTLRPRRVELVDSGHIKDSGKTRHNRRGRECTIWICNAA